MISSDHRKSLPLTSPGDSRENACAAELGDVWAYNQDDEKMCEASAQAAAPKASTAQPHGQCGHALPAQHTPAVGLGLPQGRQPILLMPGRWGNQQTLTRCPSAAPVFEKPSKAGHI